MLVKTAAIELRRTHPGAVLAALHPGTVKSALSKPFRGKANALTDASNFLLRVLTP